MISMLQCYGQLEASFGSNLLEDFSLKSLHRHLTNVHHCSEEFHKQVKEERTKAAGRKNVVCPLYAAEQVNHEMFAKHCLENHAEDGANGRPQDYSVFEKNFDNKDDYQVHGGNFTSFVFLLLGIDVYPFK